MNKTIAELRAEGAAVVVFSASELGLAKPGRVQERLTELGQEVVETFHGYFLRTLPEHELSSDNLSVKYGGGEHPKHPRADWKHAVAEGGTESGYWQWVMEEITANFSNDQVGGDVFTHSEHGNPGTLKTTFKAAYEAASKAKIAGYDENDGEVKFDDKTGAYTFVIDTLEAGEVTFIIDGGQQVELDSEGRGGAKVTGTLDDVVDVEFTIQTPLTSV